MESFPQQTSPSINPELVIRVGQGDRQAFSRLYDQSSPLLFSLIVRILGEKDDAADLLQEVYVEIWQKANQYDPERGSPMAWMVILARSRAIDRLRSKGWKSRNLTQPLDDQAVALGVTRSPNPLESVATSELRNKVGEALRVLPKEQYLALELSYYEGLSHSEIAARLNEPVGTIKTRIRLAVIKLRETLHSYWSQESL